MLTLQSFPLRDIVQRALNEDAPWGDLTSAAFVPAHATATAELRAREPGILAGGPVFAEAFHLTEPALEVTLRCQEGDAFAKGTVLAVVRGSARAILTAERVALNFTQRLCGIATLTRAFVDAIQGTRAHITDTRKTTPNLRLFERYAVRCGGGQNHRYSLSDAVMVKDNHIAAFLDSAVETLNPEALTAALRAARTTLSHPTHMEVEIDSLTQLTAVLDAEVDSILLDNFSLEDLRRAVERVGSLPGRKPLLEASGNVRLGTVRAIAETGVDLISSGQLTHSVRSLDLGLDFRSHGSAA